MGGRADVRFSIDASGELYLYSKGDGSDSKGGRRDGVSSNGRWTGRAKIMAVFRFLSLVSAMFGRAARRARRPGWQPRHIVLMGMSDMLMLTAFYVDNGPHLPVWDRLPSVAYWLLPSIVGVPIIVRAVQRRLTTG